MNSLTFSQDGMDPKLWAPTSREGFGGIDLQETYSEVKLSFTPTCLLQSWPAELQHAVKTSAVQTRKRAIQVLAKTEPRRSKSGLRAEFFLGY